MRLTLKHIQKRKKKSSKKCLICKMFGYSGSNLPNTVHSRVHSMVLEIFQDRWRRSKSRWVRQIVNSKPRTANCLALFLFRWQNLWGATDHPSTHPLPPAIFSLGLMMPHTAKWCFYEPVSEFSEMLILFWWTDFDF